MSGEELGDDEWVAQYCSGEPGADPPRNQPRPEELNGLSMIRGRVSPAQAFRTVRRGTARRRPPMSSDGVRYARVGDLRDKGFLVKLTPNDMNPTHISVQHRGSWDEHVAATFEECCSEIRWHTGG